MVLFEIDAGRSVCQFRLQVEGKTPRPCHGQNQRMTNAASAMICQLGHMDHLQDDEHHVSAVVFLCLFSTEQQRA